MVRTAIFQEIRDFVTAPLRFWIFEEDTRGLSSLQSERFRYAAKEVRGFCLDVGCGRNDRFVRGYLGGNGKSIDVFPYDNLSEGNIVENISSFPFKSNLFESVTFIANFNHIPKPLRDKELTEAYRVLKSGGNIIITMGNPFIEILAHKAVGIYDALFGTRYDIDSERGMNRDESYYVTEEEILTRLKTAGFKDIKKKSMWTQWWLNHLFIGWKK